jgi:hypothetical protein
LTRPQDLVDEGVGDIPQPQPLSSGGLPSWQAAYPHCRNGSANSGAGFGAILVNPSLAAA